MGDMLCLCENCRLVPLPTPRFPKVYVVITLEAHRQASNPRRLPVEGDALIPTRCTEPLPLRLYLTALLGPTA